jgi:hypothetical protein
MTETLDRIAAVVETAEVELARLHERRAALALRAFADDDEAAQEELGQVSDRISRLENMIDHAAAAVAEAERQERDAAAAASHAEELRVLGEIERLEAELSTLIGDVQLAARTVGERAAAALAIEGELQELRGQVGQGPRSIRPVLEDLISLHIHDQAGPLSLERVLAGRRAALIAEYPLTPDADVVVTDDNHNAEPTDESRPACTVCSHEASGEIQQALDDGVSLRELEAKYSVSRSALSRHRRHST